jgi:hypothetical protein
MGVSLCIWGCFYATYPETYDASSFKEFSYRAEISPPCLEYPSTSEEHPNFSYVAVCEATIKQELSGEYIITLGVRTDYQSDGPFLSSRIMTESETERMLELFSVLHINRQPFPNCTIFQFGFGGGEIVLKWDDIEFVKYDCGHPRLDWREIIGIERFLDSLVPNPSAVGP